MGDEGQNQQKPPLQQPVPPCHGALDTAGQQSQLAPVLAAGMHARTSRRAADPGFRHKAAGDGGSEAEASLP